MQLYRYKVNCQFCVHVKLYVREVVFIKKLSISTRERPIFFNEKPMCSTDRKQYKPRDGNIRISIVKSHSHEQSYFNTTFVTSPKSFICNTCRNNIFNLSRCTNLIVFYETFSEKENSRWPILFFLLD